MAEEAGESPGKWWHPLRVLGQIAAALSILNLMRDLQWTSLKGTLATWLDAYNHVVGGLTHVLFGWVNVSWMSVSAPESHTLVLGVLIISPVVRRAVQNAGGGPALTIAFFTMTGAVYLALCGAMVLLCPTWLGIALVVAFILIWVRVIAQLREDDRNAVLTNLGVSVGFAMAITITSKILNL
jgi:hypothetical protein